MQKPLQDAYIVAATRSPVGKAPRGTLKNVRPDDLLVHALRALLRQVPTLDPAVIEDAIVGCAMPEGEQGANVARTAVLLAGLPNTVGGVTVNRFCASGVTALAMAADRIRVGEADVIIAGGTESMSMVPMGGVNPSLNPDVFERSKPSNPANFLPKSPRSSSRSTPRTSRRVKCARTAARSRSTRARAATRRSKHSPS
jgi:acetyl-CoA acyltransferase